MSEYPRTVLEFEERFATEEACRGYLAGLRWPQGFACLGCGHPKAWWTSRGLLHCARCGHQTSVTAGTILQDTHRPLRLWFRAMWYVTSQKPGVSALGLQRVLGLGSYHTAWAWLHKLRRAMVRPGRDRLAGRVQVDETLIGGEKPGPRGRLAPCPSMGWASGQASCPASAPRSPRSWPPAQVLPASAPGPRTAGTPRRPLPPASLRTGSPRADRTCPLRP